MRALRYPALLACLALTASQALGAVEALAPAPAAAVFREAAAACARDGGELFNISLCGPLLLVDAPSRAVVADRGDLFGFLQPTPEGVWIGALPLEVEIGDRTVAWAGRRWAMVLWPLPAAADERVRRLAHEMFHRVQAELALPPPSVDCSHLDAGDLRFWLRLELRALAGALAATDEASRRAAATDALRFRARRHALLPAAAAAEAAAERHEGLAEYAGIALAWPDPAARRQRVGARLDSLPAERALGRHFAEGTGPAYALLLDELGVTWRRPRGAEADVAALLAAAVGSEPQTPEALAGVESTWDAEGVRREEAARAQAAVDRIDGYRARLVDGPVLRLPLLRASTSFDPAEAFTLDDHGTVYPTLELTDRWGVLRVRAGGALVTADRGTVVVPAPPAGDGPLVGEGWTLELAQGWSADAGDRPGDLLLRARPGGRR